MKEQIVVAAKWWADRFREGAKQDNGDLMQSLFAQVISHRLQPSPAVISAFEHEVIDRLPAYLGRAWYEDDPLRGSYYHMLDCDYHPCSLLAKAAYAAGIVPDCPPFPMKTCMWIHPNRVVVRYGYRADEEVLWEKPTK